MRTKQIIRSFSVILLTFALLLAVSCVNTGDEAAVSSNARGRPIVQNGTVLTDRGTLMRGMISGTNEMLMGEQNEAMAVGYEEISQLKDLGLNCVRFYVPIQYQVKDSEEYLNILRAADTFVDWAEELGIYVWLSADVIESAEALDIDFDSIFDYWDVLAPRYASRPHVFFDLVNELSEPPDWFTGVHPRGYITEFYAQLYKKIRAHAPDTLCIFFSFSHLIDMEDTLLQIKGLEELIDVDWTNEAVGFHSYESFNKYNDEDTWLSCELMRYQIRLLKENGYPIINTEVPSWTMSYNGFSALADYPNAYLLQVLEEEQVSWNTMLHVSTFMEPSYWKGVIETIGLTWEPDFGDWPAPGLINPFEPRAAISYPVSYQDCGPSLSEHAGMEGEPGNIFENYMPSMLVKKESQLTYPDINFGVLEPLTLTVRLRGFYDGAKVVAREGGADGHVICEIPFNDTQGKNEYLTGYLIRPINGISDVTFTFEDPEGKDCWALAYFFEWQFGRPPIKAENAHTIIWNNTIPAAYFNYREAPNLWRAVSTDADATTEMGKTLHIEGIHNGDKMLFDRVPFVSTGDVRFTVRAMPLAGGRIELYANQGFRIWPLWSFELGHCLINGEPGVWAEYALDIPAESIENVLYGGSWSLHGIDLMFRFIADEDAAEGMELFRISEFRFQI